MAGILSDAESQRIITHMQNDHPDSLIHYVQYYGKIPITTTLADPVLKEFSSKRMVIDYRQGSKQATLVHLFDPPMGPGQARKRLEEIHKEAKKAIGISDVVLTSFFPLLNVGDLLMAIAGLLIQLYLLLAPCDSVVSVISWARIPLTFGLELFGVPVTTEFLGYSIKVMLLGPLMSMHLWEALYQLPPVMRRFNVGGRGVRMCWIVATCIAGFPMWRCLKDHGEKLEREQYALATKVE